MKQLSNAERRAQTDANLERKRLWLSELAGMVRDGDALTDRRFPTDMKAFRLYEDAALGLAKVGGPKVLNRKQSPHRTDLIAAIENDLATLRTYAEAKKRRPKKASLKSQVDSASRQVKDLKYLVGRLIGQLAVALDENRKLLKSNRDNEKSNKLKSDTIKALNKKVTELGGSLLKGVRSTHNE
jgi:hypothetical protein